MKKKRADAGLTNEKIATAGEVFVVNAEPGGAVSAMTAEDVVAVDALNDQGAAFDKARRLSALRQKGALLEAQMPDSKEKILAQFALQQKGRQ